MKLRLASKKNIMPNYVMVFLLSIIVIMYQIVSVGGSSRLEYVAMFILVIIFILNSKLNLLYALMFLLPNYQYMNIGNTSFITILIILYFIRAIITGTVKLNKYLLFSGVLFLTYSLFIGGINSFSIAIKSLLHLFFCLQVYTEDEISIESKYINSILFLTIGIILSSIITIIINPDSLTGVFSLSIEQSRNSIAILSGFAFGSIIMMIPRISLKRIWYITFVPLLVIGIMTLSKTFIFMLIISLVWVLLFSVPKLIISRTYKLLLILIFTFIAVWFIYSRGGQFSESVSNALDRIINAENDDFSSGRFHLWEMYLNEFKENPNILFWGVGKSVSDRIMISPHNLWIEQLYLFGIIGNLILFGLFGIVIQIIYTNSRLKKKSLYGMLPLILVLSSSFFSHTFIANADLIGFILSIIALGIYGRERDIKNSKENKIVLLNDGR